MQQFDLTGKTAIVTGGNGGIGLAIALGLGKAGAKVMIAARNQRKNEAALSQLKEAGTDARAVICDVASQSDVESTVSDTLAAFGSIDILVNNAGISGGGAPERITDEIWDAVLDINLKSVLKFSQACHPHMKSAGGGKVINIGSMYSLFGSAQVAPYSASKGGVVQLTKSLANAWARHNIQVNAILPGWITTEMTQGAKENEAFHEMIVMRTPAGRFGEPEELAGAGVFLASSASDFVTGISLPVDGGYSVS